MTNGQVVTKPFRDARGRFTRVEEDQEAAVITEALRRERERVLNFAYAEYLDAGWCSPEYFRVLAAIYPGVSRDEAFRGDTMYNRWAHRERRPPATPTGPYATQVARALELERYRLIKAAAMARSYQEAWVYRTMLRIYPGIGLSATQWRDLSEWHEKPDPYFTRGSRPPEDFGRAAQDAGINPAKPAVFVVPEEPISR